MVFPVVAAVAFSRKHAPMIRRLRRDEERLLTIRTITHVAARALGQAEYVDQPKANSVSPRAANIYKRLYIFARAPRDERPACELE